MSVFLLFLFPLSGFLPRPCVKIISSWRWGKVLFAMCREGDR